LPYEHEQSTRGPQHQTLPRNAGHETGSPGYRTGQRLEPETRILLEAKEHIELPLLTQVAGIMKLPVEAFQNFDEDAAINIIANTFEGESVAYVEQYKCNFNPLDKIVELHEQKIVLYERMLKEKEEMMERLERLMEKTK